jgi:DNA-binding NarL/FixJ family response regulator
LIGRHGEARAELEAALEALPDHTAPEATALKFELAADAFLAAEFDECRARLREAITQAEAHGDAPTIAAATGLLAAGLYLSDDFDGARATLDRALELLAALDETGLGAHLNAQSWTGLGAISLGRLDEGIDVLDRTISAAEATGQGHLSALMRTSQSLALIWKGDLARAAEQLEAAVEASILTANPVFLTWGLSLSAWATSIRGDVPAALELADRGARAAPDIADPVSATAFCFFGEAWLAAGEPQRARDEVLAHAGGPELARVERGFRAHPYELLTRAELELGDPDAAGRWSQLARESATGPGIPGREADAARAEAVVALARDEHGRACELAREALASATAGGLRIDEGSARILLGRALAAAGSREEAVEELSRARAELEALGAGRPADAAARELRRLGVRVTRSGRQVDGAASGALAQLSSREREIAELVAAGRRNREIAETLFLSVRTVEGHLARIFRKLEVESRTQLGALVRDQT